MGEMVLTFAAITFPIFLLIPTVITSYSKPIPILDISIFFIILWVNYIVITFAVLWELLTQAEWLTFAFIIIGAILGAIPLRYVMRWTTDEALNNWFEILQVDD